ncbi:anion permease, partial [Escherichia coli]|nr:anion permease [Escherichia coli]
SAVGVSFSHGANDGQKGIGLIMLVLIGVAPAGFVVNMNSNGYDIARTHDAVVHLQQYYETHKPALNHAIENTPMVAESKPEEGEFHCDSSRTP